MHCVVVLLSRAAKLSDELESLLLQHVPHYDRSFIFAGATGAGATGATLWVPLQNPA